ncbi:hypothetical protein COCSUDRAFT_60011 [Coccomyxa subellipsoidea C-169]|uniref:Uncharacterized protein n=1 Tax=Coccomyxa subellipsoidea (strain C-169) TaxID=574566 RepID=I0YJY3_COCSC|nr:hypothetical protein COCSUDRAFT_60011 [Coccomyxa subellipsoidea C-169]EIE18702.1 hypothetical protein COCSUDRAFT_60011 [Coccomyxa subellipsoidea C-169]|eukprot:XP_005643246.1 hypothetical protein COCSUDRAFT_60011 [Coccomyxa subellipsoidea C-169]
MGSMPQLQQRPPASFQPGFLRPVQASWAQPMSAPQHPPGGYGQPWGPLPALSPPTAQWGARPARPPAYNPGGPRPPPGAPLPGPPQHPGPMQQGRGYHSSGGRGGGRSGGRYSQDGGRGRGGPPPGRGRGEGRGEASIEAYYSPTMVEDPWRSLRQTQNRPPSAKLPPQKGDGSGKRADNPAVTLQDATETDGAEGVPVEGAEMSKLSEEGAQDRPWH